MRDNFDAAVHSLSQRHALRGTTRAARDVRTPRDTERIVMHDRLYVATTDRRSYLTRIVARGRGTEDENAFCARIVPLPQLGNIKRTGRSPRA